MKHRLFYGIVRLGCVRGCPRLFPSHACRAFSDVSAPPGSALRQWTVAVSSFVKIKCSLHCNISVRPLDPHAFPGADRAFITLLGSGDVQDFSLDSFHVHYDDQSKELSIISSDESSSNMSVELTTPIKSDLQVVTQGRGNVRIQNMESDLCQVQTERGHCVLQSVKSHKVQVRSSGGDITGMGTIHGDVDISAAGDSSVDIKKIQGTAMNVSTEHGPVKVKAIYAESSSVASSSGKIHIGHLHGEARVQSVRGDVIIDSSSGALTAVTNAGNIDVYVSQTGTADLHTQQGVVSVRVPATMKAGVHLCGTMVDISSELSQETERQSAEGKTVVVAQLNGGTEEDCWIKATADRGVVSLKTQSWFETLRLGS
ncbi:protein FAM185A [Colossoma macropomum]|uniref:protein FAM185A n=1 Tax=Colossoma macropomum TaxID=42526 RepID=UPI001864C959|nr:protein FAM185A [Colossoma macropomum]